MGNSKGKPGIFINITKPFYSPGEQVQGHVYVNAPKSHPCTKIILSIVGHQRSYWKGEAKKKGHAEEVRMDTEDRSTSIVTEQKEEVAMGKGKQNIGGERIGELKIIEKSTSLATWNKEHNLLGQYAFPFAIYIPSHIPASFSEQTKKYKGSIVYQIQCTCISTKEDLHEKKELVIRIPETESNAMCGELFLRPKSCCCCCPMGVARIKCYFQKNQYVSGEHCKAFLEIDNYNCKIDINEIQAKFKKIIILKDSRRQEATFIQELKQVKFQGIKAFQQYLGENARLIEVPLKHKSSVLPPTAKGELVKCLYQLQIVPIINKGCCSKNNAQFTVSLEIVQAGIQPVLLQAPLDWNPQVFKQSEIHIYDSMISSGNGQLDRMNNYKY